MDPDISFVTGRFSERAINLVNEALTSRNPTLSPHAVQKISEIREARLADLAGSDRFQAAAFLDILDVVPPLEALRFEIIFKRLEQSDCSDEAIWEVTKALLTGRQPPEERKQESHLEHTEWGYLTGEVEIAAVRLKNPQEIDTSGAEPVMPKYLPIALDEQKVTQEGIASLVELYRILIALDDLSVRKSLVEDCAKILRLRTNIEIVFADERAKE